MIQADVISKNTVSTNGHSFLGSGLLSTIDERPTVCFMLVMPIRLLIGSASTASENRQTSRHLIKYCCGVFLELHFVLFFN